MRSFVDLHTHSTCSDGTLDPVNVIDLADAAGLAAVALTDHDTMAGLAEARERATLYPELSFVPGIEISAQCPGGVLHILGLGIDEDAPSLREMTERLRLAREERNPRMVAKLQALGLPLDMDDVLQSVCGDREPARRIVSRMHIADALRRKNLVRTYKEAFDRYLGRDGAAFVDKERILPSEAIAAIRDAGGVPTLAHPVQLGYHNSAELLRIVRDLICSGLDGVEAYHSDHSPEQTRTYLDLARRFYLVATGGSDFHGRSKPMVEIGRPRVPVSMLRADVAERWLADNPAVAE